MYQPMLAALRHGTWWNDSLLPAYLSCLSIAVFLGQIIISSKQVRGCLSKYWTRFLWLSRITSDANDEMTRDEHETDLHFDASFTDNSDVLNNIEAQGRPVIFAYKLLRLAGCLALLGLTVITTVDNTSQSDERNSSISVNDADLSVLRAALCLTYTYASVLAFFSVTDNRKWSKLANTNLACLLFATWTFFIYRDVWPLATYGSQPADLPEGTLMWIKLVFLTLTAVGIPLFIPRSYEPYNAKDPASKPNPEQTASLFSLIFYSFLDPIILKANRVAHLSPEELPPLADYDFAKQLRDRTVQHVDLSFGAKSQSLFLALMKSFSREFLCIFAVALLRAVTAYLSPLGLLKLLEFLETGGKDASIRPWVWVSWLFFGCVADSIAFQWYLFLGNTSLVRTESIITNLVFEHALRIRLKAEVSAIQGPDLERPESTQGTDSLSSIDSRPGSSAAKRADTSEAIDGDEADKRSDDNGSKFNGNKGKRKDTGLDSDQNEARAKSSSSHTNRNFLGKLNNLVTTDLVNITQGMDFPQLFTMIPFMIGLGVWLLYSTLGWSAFIGLAVMVVCLPLPGYIMTIIRHIQLSRMKKTDARVQLVTEAINIARMIKFFGWESLISKQIDERRNEELEYSKKRKIFEHINGIISFVIHIMTMIITFATYTLIMKQQLTASRVFSSMAVFTLLREVLLLSLSLLPRVIQAKISLNRVDEFLKSTELLDEFQGSSKDDSIMTPEDRDIIGFRDAIFTWASDKDESTIPSSHTFQLVLEGEVIFQQHCINLIIGPTGSGKTSLLMALLGEMHFMPTCPTSWYNLPRNKGIAYAAQESWIQNETIKDNIIFGSPYNDTRYKKVIYQCALEHDLELFDAGDLTEVGEKGITLSGGQKARVTLARAIYSSAEVIMLDDVFAALDVHTIRWVIEKCFKGDLIQGRTVLLVTHNIAMAAPIADFILSIGINGHIAAQGTVDNVLGERADQTQLEEIYRREDIVDESVDKNEKKSDGKLVIAEEVALGHVQWSAFKLYFSSVGGMSFWFLFLVFDFLQYFCYIVQVWFLGYWAAQYDSLPADKVPVPYYLSISATILGAGIASYALAYILYLFGTVNASRVIHRKLIHSILSATLRWLDSTPTGRIVTRCTQDIATVDTVIPNALSSLLGMTTGLILRLGAVIFVTPIFTIPGLFVGAIGAWCGQLFMKAQLSVKREASNAKSPVLSHFGAAMSGLVSIRAYGAQDVFKHELLCRIDRYTRAARIQFDLNRWIGIRIQTIGGAFSALLAAYLVYWDQSTTPGNIGFSLNMALAFTSLILWWVRSLNDFEVQANSLERINSYLVDIEQEEKGKTSVPPAYWPSSGDIRVENLCARYSKGGPNVLHNISFDVRSGERIGIVGRTGSGKSSLILSLLRCVETEGNVYFDTIPTNSINLNLLRQNITTIPQVPEFISGTLRQNLDPFSEHDDAVLNDALSSAGLRYMEESGGRKISLDTNIASGGSNLSVGQKQILALARAFVRNSKLLILDEATSAIDYNTDSVIQSSLRSQRKSDVTVITVAHRLHTVIDSDKIMVLDAGRLVEFDSPATLLKKEEGYFKSLVEESGDKENLYRKALDSQ